MYCEQCNETFPMKASYREVARHLSSHEAIYGELQDCIICHSDSKECPNYRLNNFFDLSETKGQFFFNIHQHNIPMCEHMWINAKKFVDETLSGRKEDLQEWGITQWCPHCFKRVPKDIETCPECGGKVGKNRGGHAGEIIQTRLKQPHPRFTNRLERRLVRSSFGRGPQSRLHNSPDHILSIP